MDNFAKYAIVSLTVTLLIWEIDCVAPQGTVIIRGKVASSASFIQNESNQQSSNQNIAVPTTITPALSTIATNRGGTRDYVNPQVRPVPTNQQNSQNRNIQIQQNFPVQSNQGVRDYVNPQIPPASANRQNIQTQSNFPVQSNLGNNRGGIRDYVNPNANTQIQQNNNRDISKSQQNSKFISSTTINSPNGGSVRDYVNPNAGKINTNNRDYVPSPRPQFPPLPSRTGPGGGVVNLMSIPITPISYANKVAGGVTTKSPVPTTKSSLTGSPSESTTTEKVNDGPTDDELRDFSEGILRRDTNNAAKYVTVNYQGKTTSGSQNDEAPQKLLDVKPEAFQISTISKIKLLHNNYILDTNENEHVTPQEKLEENDLLETMLTTSIMQYTRNFLIAKGKISKDPKDFKDLLKLLWFNMYSRGGGRIGSSGFEHIFLAEIKKNEVSGLHNWLYFDQAEINKIVDYLGYMKKIDLGDKGTILKFHFKLNGIDKPVDSMFIGTSPELEMALYTTCYMFRADRICPLRMNGHNFIVRTYTFRYRGKNMIGSAFPEI